MNDRRENRNDRRQEPRRIEDRFDLVYRYGQKWEEMNAAERKRELRGVWVFLGLAVIGAALLVLTGCVSLSRYNEDIAGEVAVARAEEISKCSKHTAEMIEKAEKCPEVPECCRKHNQPAPFFKEKRELIDLDGSTDTKGGSAK